MSPLSRFCALHTVLPGFFCIFEEVHCDGFSSVQSLSRVRLFVTPWTAARQASLSITNSRSLMLCMYCEMIPTIKLINTSITHVITPLFLPPSLPSFCFFFFFCGENTYRFTLLADFKDTSRGDRPLVERYLEPGGLFPTMHGRVTAPSC